MKINESTHFLEASAKKKIFTDKRSPNVGGTLKTISTLPSELIIHYTAAELNSTVNTFLSKAAKVSAHIVIDRDGSIYQMVPFNRIAWHAGSSVWDGTKDYNNFSVGIELINKGFAVEGVAESNRIIGRHKHKMHTVSKWEKYPKAQMDSLIELTRELLTVYNIGRILGHDDISAGRKLDPGPAFDWDFYRKSLFGNSSSIGRIFQTIGSSTNVRPSNNTNGSIVKSLSKGYEVGVIETKDNWSRIYLANSASDVVKSSGGSQKCVKTFGWIRSDLIQAKPSTIVFDQQEIIVDEPKKPVQPTLSPLQQRIKAVQIEIGVSLTSEFDLATSKAIAKLLKLTIPAGTSLNDYKEKIQLALGFKGKDVDGIVGPATMSRVENLLNAKTPKLPVGASMIVTANSLGLIIASEVSSKSAYENKLNHPVLPVADSGITIGIGYDLGYVNLARFTNDWKKILKTSDFNTLSKVLGKTKSDAKKALTTQVKNVTISWDQALEVFYTKSMPIWALNTSRIYPGVALLPPDAQGALISLVYNRGTSLANVPSRKEMRNIVGHVKSGDLEKIAKEIEAMKRLWPSIKGLRIRRDKEAELVRNATFYIPTGEYIFV